MSFRHVYFPQHRLQREMSCVGSSNIRAAPRPGREISSYKTPQVFREIRLRIIETYRRIDSIEGAMYYSGVDNEPVLRACDNEIERLECKIAYDLQRAQRKQRLRDQTRGYIGLKLYRFALRVR